MSLELKSPSYTDSLLPRYSDDLPASPPRSPQWRAKPDTSEEPTSTNVPPRRPSRIFRRIGIELGITLCLALWCILVTFICALVFGGIGVGLLKRGHWRDPGPYIQASTGNGTLVALLGSVILGAGIGVTAHLLWLATHPHHEPLVERGVEFEGHPFAIAITVLAVIAGGFAPALGVVLHPQHLVSLGYTVAMALKVYGIGLGLIAGIAVCILAFARLATAVCGE